MKSLQPSTIKNLSVHSPLVTGWVSDYAILTHFNICKKTLEAWHRKEGLPKYRIGRLTLYKETELNELIEKHKILPVAKKVSSTKQKNNSAL